MEIGDSSWKRALPAAGDKCIKIHNRMGKAAVKLFGKLIFLTFNRAFNCLFSLGRIRPTEKKQEKSEQGTWKVRQTKSGKSANKVNHQVKWKYWIIYIRCIALYSFLAVPCPISFLPFPFPSFLAWGFFFLDWFCWEPPCCLLISLIALPVWGRPSAFFPFVCQCAIYFSRTKTKAKGPGRTWKLSQIFIYEASFVRLPAVIWQPSAHPANWLPCYQALAPLVMKYS